MSSSFRVLYGKVASVFRLNTSVARLFIGESDCLVELSSEHQGLLRVSNERVLLILDKVTPTVADSVDVYEILALWRVPSISTARLVQEMCESGETLSFILMVCDPTWKK